MNRGIEIHDSTLVAIEPVGRDVALLLAPAYMHCSEGRPGVDPGSGWLQDTTLFIREAVVESSPSRLPCTLSDGAFSIGESSWENGIPLPLEATGSVSLSAVTEDGDSLAIHGLGAEAVLHGEPRYLEHFPGPGDA